MKKYYVDINNGEGGNSMISASSPKSALKKGMAWAQEADWGKKSDYPNGGITADSHVWVRVWDGIEKSSCLTEEWFDSYDYAED